MTVDFSQLQSTINNAEKILVIYGEKSRFPAVAAAASIHLWLKSLEKKVTLACSAQALVEFCTVVGINQVKNALPAENLVITIPYGKSEIDQVVSDLDTNRQELSLIVKPKKNSPPLNGDDLRVSYQIPDYDLTIMVDVRTDKELNKLSGMKPHPWNKIEKLVTFSSSGNPTPVLASISESMPSNSGFCAYLTGFFRQHQIAINQDVASNLLMGLEKETDNFRNDGSAECFELAAWLVHQGGVRYRPDNQAVQNFMPKNHLPQESLPPKYRDAKTEEIKLVSNETAAT